jgi:hypothetical protein
VPFGLGSQLTTMQTTGKQTRLVPATLKCSFSAQPLLIGGTARAFIPQSRVGLNCHTRNEVKTPAAMGGSTSAIWPGISINHHADYGNKTTKQTRQSLHRVGLSEPIHIGLHWQMDHTKVNRNKPSHWEVQTSRGCRKGEIVSSSMKEKVIFSVGMDEKA